MEKITESLLSGEKTEENFGLFCENQMMEKIIKLTTYHIKSINIIIIKNLGILIPSLKDKKILFYFFSHDYMNQIILNISYTIEEQDNDFLSYYIKFLKTIANKLDKSTLSLFFHRENNNFPLLDKANGFFNSPDVMIKNTSRNIFLSLIKLNYEPMIQYICVLPRITDIILLTDNIRSFIILITNIKTNLEKSESLSKLKEIEENLIDDILFIQDILSVGVEKINYILINCLFSIPLQYLFNCILTHSNANIAFYILNLILKNIKNECVNNLVTFVLYSSQIHIKINENIANPESNEIYNLLYLNKFFSHNSGYKNLAFDQYIILVYSENFLKSIRYVKEEDQTFDEIKHAAKYIVNSSYGVKNDMSIALKIINELLRTNSGFPNMIKKMEAYHNFVSRITGINVGVSNSEASLSFLKLIYDNLLSYSNNTIKNNIYIQENILKKECLYFIDYLSPVENQNNYINQLFLILQIIKSKTISKELKKFLCLNEFKISNIDESNDLKKSSSSDEGTHNSDEPKDNVRKNRMFINDYLENSINSVSSINSINSFNRVYNTNELKLKNKDNNQSVASETNRANLIREFFGISETQTEYILNSSSFNEENNHLSSILLIPKPVCYNNYDIDHSKQLIINKQIMNYDDMNFNNNHLNRLFFIYNSKNTEENLNTKYHDILLEKIIYIIFITEKLVSRLDYKLSIELIEHLILGSSKFQFYKEKYEYIFNEKYKKILSNIDAILLKNNSTQQKIYKNAYQYFEESFNLNKKKLISLINEYFNQESLFLFSIIQKNNNFEKNWKNNEKKDFDVMDFPMDENEIIQCLFQILIGLHDLKILINTEKNNTENRDKIIYNMLLRNSEFPLKFIDKNQNIGEKVNISHLKVNPTPFIYKSKIINQENYYVYTYHNYLFIVTQMKENNEKKDLFVVKQKLPLRQIVIFMDRGDPRTLYLSNGKNDVEAELFFDGVSKATNMKETINNAIKVAILMEFSAVKSYINNLIKN